MLYLVLGMKDSGPNRWFFDAWSRVYDWPVVQRATYRPVHDAVLAGLEPLEGRRILDIGCGTGQLTVRLHQRARVIGCDFSAGMLHRAASRSPRIPLVCGNACGLPFRDGAFNAVVCTEAFHWFPDQTAALAEFYRILAKGGLLMVAFVNTRLRLTSEVTRAASRLLGEPLFWPTMAQMRRQVEDAGFHVVGQERIVRLPGLLFPPVLTTAVKKPRRRR